MHTTILLLHLGILYKWHQFLHVGLELSNGLESFQYLFVRGEGVVYLDFWTKRRVVPACLHYHWVLGEYHYD